MSFGGNPFTISSTAALRMGENLLLTLNTIILNLPELKLRRVRCAMTHSVQLADELLYHISVPPVFGLLSPNAASTIPGDVLPILAGAVQTHPGIEDVSNSGISAPPPSPMGASEELTYRSPPQVNNDAAAPGKPLEKPRNGEDAGVVDTTTRLHEDPDHPFIISSHPYVRVPNYRLHPKFVKIGVPSPYLQSPTNLSMPPPPIYCVITKGLYLGIFSNWEQCSAWVTNIPGSVYATVRDWPEAMYLYNGHLAAGACEVLN